MAQTTLVIADPLGCLKCGTVREVEHWALASPLGTHLLVSLCAQCRTQLTFDTVFTLAFARHRHLESPFTPLTVAVEV